MLTEVQIKNFRGFDEHYLSLRPVSILVGRNNAGKSTITEALRLVSIITSRYGAINFKGKPEWSELPLFYRGINPSLKGLDFVNESVFHNLGSPPSQIEAKFSSGSRLEIFLGSGADVYAAIFNAAEDIIKTKSQASKFPLPSVSILPQIGPLAREEKILDSDYVRRVSTTPLASAHFRNHLKLYKEAYSDFVTLCESTWPGLRFRGLEGTDGMPGDRLGLFIQDGEFVAEVAWLGHGLQMWLQVMWFLARNRHSHTIILDEPDVYLHADLQRKLVRILQDRHKQTIIATHSVEIISEVDPDNILIIERKTPNSKFATSLPSVQKTLDSIGSIHNIHLARLWGAKKFIMVEGKDLRYLKLVQDKVTINKGDPFDSIPNMQIGGWGGWSYVIGSNIFLRNAFDENIAIYCILDSDYHTSDEITERLNQAKDRKIFLRIWSKKEIENYFIVPSVLVRVIKSEIPAGKKAPDLDEILNVIDQLIEQQREPIFDALATEFLASNRREGLPQANKRAREVIDAAWETQEKRLSIVSGKKLISQLSRWSQEIWQVPLSPMKLIRNMERTEIDPELLRTVRAIENGNAF